MKALDSIRNQTYKDFEIIIVDDGSTDNTEEVIRAYKNKYKDLSLKYLYQENQKQAKARNYGIENANGEYIAFLDSDDEWMENKLKCKLKQ
jgi:glycosyltransferase involved in cell wall biosynthesis